MSKIGIVTVVRNEKHNLADFYNSLIEQTFRDFTLYFVDNNSTDGSQQLFNELNKNKIVKVSFIVLDYNSGFAAGSNIGAKAAISNGCEYLFILNNDVILDKKCLEELIKLIEFENNIAAVGLLLFRHKKKYPDIIQEYGGKIKFKKGFLKKYYENLNVNDIKLPDKLETDFIGGGMCFVKAAVFQNVGMFEESYFGYFDEIDLSYRLKLLNHYKMYVTSRAIAYHNHNWTKKNKLGYYIEYYLGERNKFLYYRKYKLYPSIVYMALTDLVKFPWRQIWFIKVCDFKLGLYYLKGMKDGLLGKSGKPEFI